MPPTRVVRSLVVCLLVWGAVLAVPSGASAHTRTSTFSEVDVADREVLWRIRVRVAELLQPLGLPEGTPAEAVVARGTEAARYVSAHLGVRESGEPCLPGLGTATRDGEAPEPTLALTVPFSCPRLVRSVKLRYDLFFDLDDLHSGFASVRLLGARVSTHIFRSGSRELGVERVVSRWEEAREYLVLGIEHIFTGYDHLAFLGALLLGAALSRRSSPQGLPVTASVSQAASATLAIVTSFTVAHSLTLIGSALRPALFPTRWVEPVIALSVAWVGIENLLPFAKPRRRWPEAFLFGLVHGFGFASVLREVGLPRAGLVQALLAFNVGVELGQLTVVLVVLPVLLFVARRGALRYERWVLKGGSAVLAALGMVWFFLRLLG